MGRLINYVGSRYEDGAFSGVARFDHELKRVFQDLVSVTTLPVDLSASGTVITDNHKSLDVPGDVPTVVVHHGCAAEHFKRDPSWRTPASVEMVKKQRLMFGRPNRTYVAPSAWTAEAFRKSYRLPDGYATVIPHHVPLIDRPKRHPAERPVILGD